MACSPALGGPWAARCYAHPTPTRILPTTGSTSSAEPQEWARSAPRAEWHARCKTPPDAAIGAGFVTTFRDLSCSALLPFVLGVLLALGACSDDPNPSEAEPDASSDADEDMGGDASCDPGSEGCACRSGGTCDTADDEGNELVCSTGNVCVEEGSTDCTGGLECICGEGDTCDTGLSCEGGVCTLANGLVLTLEAGDARACDVRLETTRDVVDVFYPEGVRGEHRSRDAVAAIALMRTADTALAGTIAVLAFGGDDATSAEDVTALSATCYGRLGTLEADAVPAIAPLPE